jgi:ligand-binding SRPBCC domain-containing protein
MPVFESETVLACLPETVFDFLARPANLARVSPPELHLRLVEGPERLALGARITVQGSKFGVPQKVVSEVTAFEEGMQFTDTQVQGPFGRFVHTHRVESAEGGTRIFDRIEYEAPGGLLGLLLTNQRIQQDLEALAIYRAKRFKELLEAPS